MGWLNDHINLISFIAAIIILVLTVTICWFYIKKMQTETNDGELTEHEWDGIREFHNDVPVGYLLALFGVLVWAIWYILFGYPLNSYSQIGEYNEEAQAHSQKFDTVYANLDSDKLKLMGEQIFLVQCSQCHGITAEGIDGKAQNLTHWGKVDGIMDTIRHGSAGLKNHEGEEYGAMPEGLLTEEKDIQAVAHYVMSEIVGDVGGKYDEELVKHGKALYHSEEIGTCFTCHGQNGEGVEGVGPSLQNYGKTEFLANVLKYGKKGNIGFMPSFEYLGLSNKEVEALQSFIASRHTIQ
ncbi:c-type cytochrome [Helicobacter sp. MIT 14-3879]|uniref:c-type cytochrome n=1 Tax=Helicobacter sp. MIT 14-3879 TaxID=2040649 RepID=UPI000E1E7235|nr:c-type cytochrome [Helicobacter sp. MIT 14-3879]RDU61453.1 cytochrome-c oxidase, cbb3-type subunit III [Helicobacter sp. MIT 14-3879]